MRLVLGALGNAETSILRWFGYIPTWLAELDWHSSTSIDDFYQQSISKCNDAIATDEIDTFIAHRAAQLIDETAKQQAIKMADDIANVDGELDEKERYAIGELKAALKLF